jgi:hypothetical protein
LSRESISTYFTNRIRLVWFCLLLQMWLYQFQSMAKPFNTNGQISSPEYPVHWLDYCRIIAMNIRTGLSWDIIWKLLSCLPVEFGVLAVSWSLSLFWIVWNHTAIWSLFLYLEWYFKYIIYRLHTFPLFATISISTRLCTMINPWDWKLSCFMNVSMLDSMLYARSSQICPIVVCLDMHPHRIPTYCGLPSQSG